MKTTLFITFLAVTFLVPFRAAAEPAELTAARLAYEAKLAGPKTKLDATLAVRGKQYAGVIKALEERALLDGNLDAVVLLKAEREAYEKGKRTSGFGTNAAKVPPEARDARRLLDGEFARLRAAAAPEGRRFAGEYVKALEGVERKLTMQKDVAGAVEVRKEKTAIQDDEMDPLTEGGNLFFGSWQFVNKQGEQIAAKIFKFRRDGTWQDSNGGKGTWKWTDKTTRMFEMKWAGEDWITHDTISADGTEIKVESGSPTRKMVHVP